MQLPASKKADAPALPPGSAAFIGSALLFTAVTLLYAVKGGLRSSIITDVLQSAVFVLFLGIVLFYVLPSHGPSALLSNGGSI